MLFSSPGGIYLVLLEHISNMLQIAFKLHETCLFPYKTGVKTLVFNVIIQN